MCVIYLVIITCAIFLYIATVSPQDGHLLSGDHLLQIGDVNVRGMGSEQVASVLRQSGAHVRLIIARPVNEPTPNLHSHAQVVPTYQIEEHLHSINETLMMMDGMNDDNMGVPSEYYAQIHQVRSIPFELVSRALTSSFLNPSQLGNQGNPVKEFYFFLEQSWNFRKML